jgi:hypothetical protein
MSYRTETIREVAVEGVPCGWTYGRGGCKGDHGKPSVAVHVLLKSLPVAPKDTPLCAYHSPFDVEVMICDFCGGQTDVIFTLDLDGEGGSPVGVCAGCK